MPGQKFGPAWFPGLIANGLGLCGLGLIAAGARARSRWLVMPDWIFQPRPALGVATVLAGLLFYILLADTLGFHLTAFVLLAVWMRVLGASWPVTLPVALIATLAIQLAFYKLLRVPLPWGVFERWAF
jgi:putative tricarboxylic transport membrane protein